MTRPCFVSVLLIMIVIQIGNGQQIVRTQKPIERQPFRYLLYIPKIETNETVPLVLFLHGGGEGGNDIEKVKKHGLPKLIEEGRTFPFIVVSPQNPSESQFWDDQQLSRLVDELQAELPIDPSRVYLTGLSRGGYGVWRLAIQNPDRFAAIVPICGGGLAPYAKKLKDVPAWVFHGARDSVIPLEESQRMVDALRKAGNDVKFTIYPEGNHDAWTETYENPELYQWLLKQRRAENTLTPSADQGSANLPRVFQDYVYVPKGGHFSELDPNTKRDFTKTHTWARNMPRHAPRKLDLDLTHAEQAAFSVTYWGGHIGTSGQRFNVNGHGWRDLPQPVGMQGKPECYHRTLLGNNAIELPLGHLNSGTNAFQFAAGPQIAYDFDFGFYWIYGFKVRVYYSTERPHPIGDVQIDGDPRSLGDLVTVGAQIEDDSNVARVDFFAETYDFDWDGDGVWREWQFIDRHGAYERHLGTATNPPWKIEWDTRWLPDQQQPMRVRAQIIGRDGTSYLTAPKNGLRLARTARHVTLHASSDVPERFSARDGAKKGCTIQLPDSVENVTAARLIVSTWSASTDADVPHEIILNGKRLANRFGTFHDYACTIFDLDVTTLHAGANSIEIYSEYKRHALEINWPGPVILLETMQ